MERNGFQMTKISVPAVFHELLPRNGIASLIDGAPPDEAVCVVAPYGFGKTLSVVSWLRDSGTDAAWLTADESDNDEKRLLAGMCASVMKLCGDEYGTDEIIRDAAFVNDPLGFFWERVYEAENRCDKRVFVIDNFNAVWSPTLQRLIKNIVAALLGRWRVIVISRAEMPPVFNDLMLKRRIRLITPAQLGFSEDEIGGFFKINGRDISTDDIQLLRTETEGWPASLNIVLTISMGCPVVYGEAARSYVTGFFETEVWNGLDNDTKDFLLKTSVLEKLTPTLCNAVTDEGASLPVLRRLFMNGMFMSRLDENESYRYHRVFRTFLLDKLNESGINDKELYRKLAWSLFETGDVRQSFPYFFKSCDLYGLSRVLRVLNPAVMGLEAYLEMTECLTALDVRYLTSYPVIVARIALIHYLTGNTEDFGRLYNTFLEWIEPGNLPITAEEYAEYVWEAGWLCYINPAEPVLNNTRHEEWCNYREYVPHLKTIHLARGAVFRFPSILRGTRDYCPSLSTLDAFIKHNRETGYSIIREETSLLEMNMILAEYAYELEDYAKAERLLRASTAKAESLNMPDLYFVCAALLAKLIRAAYNPDEINALEARVESMILQSDMHFLLPNFHAFRQRNRLAAGQSGFTAEFEAGNTNYVEKPFFYLLYRHVTFARVLLSIGRYSETMLLLGRLGRICSRYDRTMDLIEVNILKSITDYKLGSTDSAGRYMAEAVGEARRFGFIRLFSDNAGDTLPILEDIYGKSKDTYAKQLMISCKKTLARAGIKVKKTTVSELTKTELKILKTLNVDMSYEEIALDNGIKVSTVKSHIHSIYSKLNVDNRTSAIITAKDIGLID